MVPKPGRPSSVLGRLSRTNSVVSTEEPAAEDGDRSESGAADMPETVDPTEGNSEQGKLRQVLGILKKSFGVKDLASVRLSLPANLLEPVGNLEHWHYQSRPDIFAAIGDSDDALERMLGAIRYAFTKDLKHARQGVCKPYNSALGEQFRCIWEVKPVRTDPETHEVMCQEFLDPDRKLIDPAANVSTTSIASERDSISSKRSSYATRGSGSQKSSPNLQPSVGPSIDEELASDTRQKLQMSSDASSVASSSNAPGPSTAPTSVSSGGNGGGGGGGGSGGQMRREKPPDKVRVIFINEQISHHPPISAFWNESVPSDPDRQRVIAVGYDQLGAKFTGTSVKVFAGGANKGIFVRLPDRGDEEYQITHPVASISGFFRGSLYVTVSDSTYITCTNAQGGRRLRALVCYIDESWLGKPKYGVEGIVYEYDDGQPDLYKKIKEVPEDRILVRFHGSWRGKVMYSYTRGDDQAERTLIDLTALYVVPKIVRPVSNQGPKDSRQFWAKVTESIQRKEFSQATKHKQIIEQAQRDAAAARAKHGEEWVPAFFPAAISDDGKPRLSEGGEKARQEELRGIAYSPGAETT